MKDRSNPKQLYYATMFILGVLTAFNIMLSIREPGWLALILFGLATGAVGGTVILEALNHYGAREGGELSGRTRRKIAFVTGVVFGAALTPAMGMANGIGGGFLFIVGLVVGSRVSDGARRMLRYSMSIRTAQSGGHSNSLADAPDVRIPRFTNDSTREQLVATAVMVLGFGLSAAVVLGAYAGFLAIMGR